MVMARPAAKTEIPKTNSRRRMTGNADRSPLKLRLPAALGRAEPMFRHKDSI
jgi:hypothetical protein